MHCGSAASGASLMRPFHCSFSQLVLVARRKADRTPSLDQPLVRLMVRHRAAVADQL
ncbi:MAG: hypothetical protein IPJ25_15845 [Rhodocyclaceae bacterium]|nr:hypothetical protein [Rhodocyclaceae bacterium]